MRGESNKRRKPGGGGAPITGSDSQFPVQISTFNEWLSHHDIRDDFVIFEHLGDLACYDQGLEISDQVRPPSCSF